MDPGSGLNNIFFDADGLTMYSAEEQGNDPFSNAADETSPLATHGLET